MDVDTKQLHESGVGHRSQELVDVEAKLGAIEDSVERRIAEVRSGLWAVSEISWLQSALERTRYYYRNGPRGPVTWVLTGGKEIPLGAFVAGEENGEPVYVARGYLQAHHLRRVGTLQVGKASRMLLKGATLGYGWDEYNVDIYEVLVASPLAVQWVHASGSLNVAALGARPVEGGYEAPDAQPLYISQAYLAGTWRPGKHSAQLGGAFIPYGGREVAVERCRILCYV